MVSWCARRRNDQIPIIHLICPRKTLPSVFLYVWFELVASVRLLPLRRGNLWEYFGIVSIEGGYDWFWWAGAREAKYLTMCGKAPHNRELYHVSWLQKVPQDIHQVRNPVCNYLSLELSWSVCMCVSGMVLIYSMHWVFSNTDTM